MAARAGRRVEGSLRLRVVERHRERRSTAPSNTGIFPGFDLDNSGAAGDFVPNDSVGFGFFPGQFGMAVYSMYPIDVSTIRTFQNFLWKDMPGALLPDDPALPGPADWYSPAELDVFRLSSKSHWDLPIQIDGRTVHFLVSHPTPPVFDGAEDRNGTRNRSTATASRGPSNSCSTTRR